MRINRWLVEQGVAPARRKADEIIVAGRVELDGRPAQLGDQVIETSEVVVDGRIVRAQDSITQQLIAYHKPVGEICSHAQQGSAKTIFTNLPPEFRHYKIIGRLDKDSEGLVLLTNDGKLAQSLAHPRANEYKCYEVTLNRKLTRDELNQLGSGVLVDGDMWRLGSVRNLDSCRYEIMLQEGKNRQIRRCMLAVGARVEQLKRTHIGVYMLGDLEVGTWREEPVRV